ncbi:hypothetical protein J132_03030 [Termitomyces sp. J132]|nr:hypothetical protein H2248_003664 [Termitomyces sp. 'cryptogamus']KNZ81041.1 hypothetical protein J132_03030 [Termitomyces sp. J132]
MREKEYTLSEAQRDNIFQESLHDFQHKFEAEEEVRSAGEQTREDKFNCMITDLSAIFFKKQLRRQELCYKTDALQEERFQKAEAAREAIFAQGQTDHARAFEIDQEMRGKRAEWYNAARQELVGDGRQRLKDKCAALNAALIEQFEKLMKRVEPVYLWRILTTSPPLSVPTSGNSSPTRVADKLIQPALDLDDDDIPSLVDPPQSPPLGRTLPTSPVLLRDPFDSSSVQSPFDLSIQSTSTESHDQQEEPLHSLTEQGDLEENTNELDQVVDNNHYTSFTHSQNQRQETFLKDESEREHRFHASEATRNNRESQRSGTFEQKILQWSHRSLRWKESRVRQFHGREEERSRGSNRRSTAFKAAQQQYSQVFNMSLSHIIRQADAEADLEEVWFERQKGMLLALYKSQANQLADASHRQLTSSYVTMLSNWLLDSVERVMGRLSMYEDRDHESPERVAGSPAGYEEDLGEKTSYKPLYRRNVASGASVTPLYRADASFTPSALFRAGAFVQNALPIPHIAVSANSNTSQRISGQRRMHGEFEESQKLRAKAFKKGANDRNRIHTINEAKRGGEFMKAQQKRKEDFDEAEESRESEFQDAQECRESEFQANERKREEDFLRDEMERNAQARRAQEDREERFQSTMSTLQRNCVEANERRLEELEAWGQELLMSREPGQERLRTD